MTSDAINPTKLSIGAGEAADELLVLKQTLVAAYLKCGMPRTPYGGAEEANNSAQMKRRNNTLPVDAAQQHETSRKPWTQSTAPTDMRSRRYPTTSRRFHVIHTPTCFRFCGARIIFTFVRDYERDRAPGGGRFGGVWVSCEFGQSTGPDDLDLR